MSQQAGTTTAPFPRREPARREERREERAERREERRDEARDRGINDAQVLALTKSQPAQAFEIVYGQYKGRVHTFALGLLGDVDQADDLVQEVFTKAFRALPGLSRDHRILPWLYRVANNAAIDQLRRRKRITWLHLGKLLGTSHEPRAAGGPESVPDRHDVAAVLRTLPPENASALLLHALEGYSYREIGEIQGCSMTAVRSRIARAREVFRRTYRPR